MTKIEHINYWLKSASDDYDAFLTLFNNGKYLYSFFIAHLTLEKIIKAHWVKDNIDNFPPKTHNLIYLIKQTKLQLTIEQLTFCTRFNDFQIQGRYPDYQFNIQKILTPEYVANIKEQFEDIRECLINKI